VDGSGVAVIANTSKGISVDGSGVAVIANTSKGISVDNTGVAVIANASKGISVDGSGVAVIANTSKGISVDGSGVAVIANTSKGISVDSSGVAVKVKANGGIKVDANGVAIDPNNVLPKGVIVMFSGSTAPTGWALCDGNNGTPNLIDRFILGGKGTDINGVSTNTASGTKNSKLFDFSSDEATLTIDGKTLGRALSLQQIPNHAHFSGIIMDTEKVNYYGSKKITTNVWGVTTGDNTSVRYIYKSSGVLDSNNNVSNSTLGGNSLQTHDHDIKITGTGKHSHKNKVTVPYYILAFIIKL
ncbi:tail fiber protein, partial [Photorhabdus sp. RM125S]